MSCPHLSNDMEPQPLPNRRSIRLPEFDYTQNGVYFITICSHNRTHIFGEIVNGEMNLSRIGEIAQQCLLEIPDHFGNSELIASVVMPNHLHLLIGIINEDKSGTTCRAPTNNKSASFSKPISKSISTIIGSYKAAVTKIIIRAIDIDQKVIWQRGYYEHIIRNEEDLKSSYEYIILNPANWGKDSEYLS
jgi:putative transposase